MNIYSKLILIVSLTVIAYLLVPPCLFAVTEYEDGMIDPSGATYQSSSVGIGTDDPFSQLCIHGGAGENDGALTFDVDGTDWYIGVDDSDTDKLKIGTGSAVGSNVSITITSGGRVGIGQTAPAWWLDVYDNTASYAMRIFNDGNVNDRSGLIIQNGTDDNSGVNTHVEFRDGNGDQVGSIRSTGGTVTYDDFTASHDASIHEKDNEKGYPYGTVMCLISSSYNKERPRQPAYVVESSTKKYDKAVFGIYAHRYEDKENLHLIHAVGDGSILVTDEGGNIKPGDYLTTSSTKGYAMKQDDDRVHNYTIAKALEPVDWEAEKSNVKLIGCTYHAQ